MFEIEKLVDCLSNLTLVQASELTSALEKKLGISKVCSSVGLSSNRNNDSVKKDTKNTFNVLLKSSGQEKIKIIKAVKDITGLGLKEARDKVHALNITPLVLKNNVDRSTAESLKKSFTVLGADVIIS